MQEKVRKEKMRNARISLTECEQENHFTLKQKPKYGNAIIRTLNSKT